jgi:hypothetical protein
MNHAYNTVKVLGFFFSKAVTRVYIGDHHHFPKYIKCLHDPDFSTWHGFASRMQLPLRNPIMTGQLGTRTTGDYGFITLHP